MDALTELCERRIELIEKRDHAESLGEHVSKALYSMEITLVEKRMRDFLNKEVL